MVCSIEAENQFGPAIGADCRGGFDFTLLFEQLFLSVAPIAVASLLIPFRLYQLLNRSSRVQIDVIYHIKLVRFSPPPSSSWRA